MSRSVRIERLARRQQRREELLDAALRTVRRVGPAASMDDIAAEAGITKPILYRHFGDRRGLVAALADRFAQELLSTLRAALAEPAAPRDILSMTIDAYLGFVEADPSVYRLVLGSSSSDPVAGDAVSAFLRLVAQEVAVVLGEQLRQVGADSGAAEPWAFGIVGMVQLAGDWWVERRTLSRARLVEYLTTLLWAGLASQEPAQSSTAWAPPSHVPFDKEVLS